MINTIFSKSEEMKEWYDSVKENLDSLQLIVVDCLNLKLNPLTRNIDVLQMVTWMLDAASAYYDFSNFKDIH